MTKEIEPITINGERYFRCSDFAHAVHKNETTIYRLINQGNSIRKLKATYNILETPLIPERELTAFPWTGAGRFAAKNIGHFDKNGKFTECDICSLNGPGYCPNTKEDEK